MKPEQDMVDGYWRVVNDHGETVIEQFESEQDAWDWIESFGDEGIYQ